MDEDIRQKIINEATKIQFTCLKHPQEIANMFITDESSPNRGIICGTCYTDILQSEQKVELQMKPLKFVFAQIHQSCTTLLSDLGTSAFIDHHLNLIRTLAKHHLPHIQPLVQASVTNYFQKYRDFITGRYFQEFYATLSSIVSLHKESKNRQHLQQINSHIKKIVEFAIHFQKFIMDFEDYPNLTLEEKITGQGMLKQIKSEISDIYKEFREKITASKKSQTLGEDIIQLFNPKTEFNKFYRFSPTLIHQSLKLVDPKKIKIPDIPDNEYTLMALIEPCIGSQKKSIKFKMQGIKGWVAVGIAIRKKAQQNMFKFQSSSAHGSFQISYDGYSWSEDSSVNEQYTSWYYNEGDIVTLTVNPAEGQLIYVRNGESHNPYTLKFKVDKKDKLYFCASVNYNEDCVSIVE